MSASGRSFDVLIVEDEVLLAMDIAAMVEDAGHRVVGECASVADLGALAIDLCPTLAFVDVQLAEGSSGLDACVVIRQRWENVAIVFVTANPLKIPKDCCGAFGVIAKPFSSGGFMAAVRYIEKGLFDPPASPEQPSSFVGFAACTVGWR